MTPGVIKLFILAGTNADPQITYSEGIPYKVDGIDLLECFKYTMGRCETNVLETPMYVEMKGMLKKYPAEAVRFLNDPVLKDYAAKLLEGDEK